MEELAAYNPELPIGILGGSSGTTYDAFKLIAEAQKYGARVALFGRKIKDAEHQLAFIEFLRLITDGSISPEEAVPAYHGVLEGLNIKPFRSLEDDMKLQTAVMSYGSSGTSVTVPEQPAPQEMKPEAASAQSQETVPAAPVAGEGVPAAEGEKKEEQPAAAAAWPMLPDGSPDFDKMTPQQKIDWGLEQRSKVLGKGTRRR
jgi:hypothetical protein